LRIRIKDIADRAGVSAGTVDRVLHNRGEVASKTREKVMGILEEMNYEPDILASSLASRSPLRVAVLIPFHTPENWFWREPLIGINDACAELNHFRIEVREYLYDQFDKKEFRQKADEVLASVPDAVIAAPVFSQETAQPQTPAETAPAVPMPPPDPDRPLIVQSDNTLLLDVHSKGFEDGRSDIASIAQLEKSPEHIHTYRITPLSLWNAAPAGSRLIVVPPTETTQGEELGYSAPKPASPAEKK